MHPVRRHRQRRRPAERRQAGRHQPMMRAAGARPPILQVVGTDDQHGCAGDRETCGPSEPQVAQPRRGRVPGQRDDRGESDQSKAGGRDHHHQRARCGRGRPRRRPLRAGSELRKHRHAKGRERCNRAAHCSQSGPGLVGARKRVAGETRAGAPGYQPAPDHVRTTPPASRLLGHLGQQQLGELRAVPGSPGRRVPPEEPAHPIRRHA